MSGRRYLIVGGDPFRGYTGTLTYTKLRIVCSADSKADIKRLVKANYDDCGGLMLIIDTTTGKEADI